jgi:hypothetical protein
MVRRGSRSAPEVVVVERGGDSSAKWLFWGAVLGAGVALLYAPRNGEETRRSLQRGLWKLRAMTEEKLDELVQTYGPQGRAGGRDLDTDIDGDDLDADEDFDPALERGVPPSAAAGSSAREELERRLAEARARRRGAPADYDEEPLA